MAIVERQKVLIYATYRGRLLVFDEPDFPDVELQVPGGTVDPGEAVLAAAQREFCEETGLPCPDQMNLLATVLYDFHKNDGLHRHHRSFFHAPLKPPLAETWEHYENFADGGEEPILFRFSWMNIAEAGDKLGYGMNQLLDRIPK
ncbi:8-oxo-dGTP pyrophosphatase MutT (NUDIX family) [Phyllobacterium myrsinacearum]|uniref:NUDIX hydrolase n=1 Tax=Phyllobacterium myrsinacearum TaxID=28101 RepID=UPI00102A09DF|nr:NUDIX domain-containing protein [Phyllobacterium myrsinacearum]RZS82141.1 8-oxo-dGTP pyrophosphatase MutT (NUDIX family) [Phyllobacterium myrsinacearum]